MIVLVYKLAWRIEVSLGLQSFFDGSLSFFLEFEPMLGNFGFLSKNI